MSAPGWHGSFDPGSLHNPNCISTLSHYHFAAGSAFIRVQLNRNCVSRKSFPETAANRRFQSDDLFVINPDHYGTQSKERSGAGHRMNRASIKTGDVPFPTESLFHGLHLSHFRIIKNQTDPCFALRSGFVGENQHWSPSTYRPKRQQEANHGQPSHNAQKFLFQRVVQSLKFRVSATRHLSAPHSSFQANLPEAAVQIRKRNPSRQRTAHHTER